MATAALGVRRTDRNSAVSSPPDQVVIVGAGLTGLVTASELAERGIPTLVLEAQPRIGGRVRSITFPDGAVAEAHLEEFWETSPAFELLRRLDLPLIEHAAHSSVLLDGGLHPYRGSADRDAYLAALFPGRDRDAFWAWNDGARAVLGELNLALRTGDWGRRLVSLRRTDLRSFIGRQHMPRSVASWIRLQVESETAVEWHRIAALDGVAEMRPFLMDAVASVCERNFSVAGGNERLIEALAQKIPEGCIRNQAAVRRVVDRGDGSGVEVHYEDALGHPHVARGRHAVLTAPVWALRRIDLDPALGALSRVALASTRAGSFVKVILRLRAEAEELWAPHGPHLFPLLSDGPLGCLYLGHSRPADADHVLTVLIQGRFARALNGLAPGEIASRVISGLDRLEARRGPAGVTTPLLPGISRLVTGATVFDHPHAVAYWPHVLGRSRFDAAAAALRAPHGNVFIGGDTTDSSHSDGAVRAGQRMAALIGDRMGAAEVAVR